METFERTREIAKLVGGLPKTGREVRVSETMRPDCFSGSIDDGGLWDPGSASIIILRSERKSLRSFAGTFLHEIAHARSGRRSREVGEEAHIEVSALEYIGSFWWTTGAIAMKSARS